MKLKYAFLEELDSFGKTVWQPGYRLKLFYFLGIVLGLSLFEIVGIATLYPVMLYIEKDKDYLLEEYALLSDVENALNVIGLEINLSFLVFMVVIPIVFRFFLAHKRTVFAYNFSSIITQDKRKYFFRKIFYENYNGAFAHKTSDVTSFILQDCYRYGEFARVFLEALASLIVLSIFIAILARFSPVTVLLMAGTVSLVFFLYRKVIKSGEEMGQEINNSSKIVHYRLYEYLLNFRLIKQRSYEEKVSEKCSSGFDRLRLATIQIISKKSWIDNTTQFILVALILIGFVLAVNLFENVELSILSVFVIFSMRMAPHISAINSYRFEMRQNYQAVAKIENIDSLLKQEEYVNRNISLDRFLFNNISLEKVSYQYDKDKVDVLEQISLTLQKNTITALVGHSGAGKTTLANIVSTVIHASSGSIKYGKEAQTQDNIFLIRNAIGFVEQQPTFFNETLRYNLTFSLSNSITDDAIIEVLRKTDCYDFYKNLTYGLDTLMENNGARFSGGERQRLAIAREILASPQLLILDEPSSALDGMSEKKLIKTITALKNELIILVIAHKINTIKNADKVVLMEKGKILTINTPDYLKQNNEVYQKLFSLK